MSASEFILIRKANGEEIALKEEQIAGRGAACAVTLSATEGGSRPSREHARITLADGGAWVEDLKSTNGTFVNDARITSRTRLKSGDRLRFDLEEFALTEVHKTPPPDVTLPRLEAAVAGGAQPEASASAKVRILPDFMEDDHGGGKTKVITQEVMERWRKEAANQPPSRTDGEPGTPHLTVRSGTLAGKRLELPIKGATEWSIGSDADRAIRFADQGVSGRQAKIVNDGAHWKLMDDMSQNGTFVNGKRITLSYLNSGDRVAFGPVECTIHLPGQRRRRKSPAGVSRRMRFVALALASFVITVVIVLVALYFIRDE